MPEPEGKGIEQLIELLLLDDLRDVETIARHDFLPIARLNHPIRYLFLLTARRLPSTDAVSSLLVGAPFRERARIDHPDLDWISRGRLSRLAHRLGRRRGDRAAAHSGFSCRYPLCHRRFAGLRDRHFLRRCRRLRERRLLQYSRGHVFGNRHHDWRADRRLGRHLPASGRHRHHFRRRAALFRLPRFPSAARASGGRAARPLATLLRMDGSYPTEAGQSNTTCATSRPASA